MKKTIILLLGVFLFVELNVFAQIGQSGEINGIVRGPENLTLPGVVVKLKSTALVIPLDASTDVNGAFRFLGLPPGIYEVIFILDGMDTLVRKGIIVRVGKTTTVFVKMRLKTLMERIIVPGKSPTIDRQNTAGVSNVDIQLLEMVPVPQRTVMEYFNLVPGIAENTAHGSGVMENSYNLDGVNMGDPVTGTNYVSIGMDALEEVAIQSGGLSSEYGSVKGAVLNGVTRSGGNTFSGSAFFYFNNEKLQANNTSGTDLYNPNQIEKTGIKFQLEPGFCLGGPILKNKLWFFGNLSMITKKEYIPGYPHDKSPENSVPIDQNQYFPYIKLTFQPSSLSKFFFSYSYSDLKTNHRGASRYYNEDTTQNQKSPCHVLNFHWSKNFGTRFYVNLKAAVVKSEMNFHSKTPGAQYHDWLTGFQTGTNWRNKDDSKRDRYQLNIDFTTFINRLVGSHEIKIGGEMQIAKTSWLLEVNPDPITGLAWQFNWPESIQGNGIYYGFHIKPFNRKENMLNYSLFINDIWNVNKQLTLNIGFRYDYNSTIWPAQNQSEYPIFNPFGILVDRRIFSKITPVKWHNFSPRLGLIYDLLADGKTLLKLSWGRYVMPNTIQLVNLAHPNGWYYWMDVYYGYDFVQISQSLTRPGGTKVGYKENKLIAPTSREFTVGIQRELWEDWSLGCRYIKKWDKDLIHIVDASALDIDALMEREELVWIDWEGVSTVDPYDGTMTTFYNNLNPSRIQDQYIVNPPGAEREYDGIELTLNKLYSRGWSLNASYVYANSRGLIGLNRDDVDGSQSLGTSNLWVNPNAHINAYGRFPYERRHQFKVIGLLRAKWGIHLGFYFRHLSGQRWTRAITSSFLGIELNQISETIKAEKRGSNGYPPINLLDIKIQKAFQLGNVHLKLFADIFNVFNASTIIQEYLDSSNPFFQFGQDLDIVNPRVVRFGAKIEF